MTIDYSLATLYYRMDSPCLHLISDNLYLTLCVCWDLVFISYLLYTENGEGLQVLHYEVGQKYEPHYDYFMDEYNTRNGGQRIATVLMYL